MSKKQPITINLLRTWEEHEPLNLGILAYYGDMAQSDIEQYILAQWREFNKTEPDSDGEFPEWLVDKNPGFFGLLDSPDMEVVLED